SGIPAASPSDVALRSTAERRSALSTFATATSGSAGAASGGEAPDRSCVSDAFRRRCNRSVARRGNHSASILRPSAAWLLEEAIVTPPFHDPAPRAPMPVAHKLCFKDREAAI